jgi:predicted ArsR family transcriptional regulator
LALLEQHGSLGYEQIAAHLGEPPDAVRNALTGLRERGFIDVLSVGELQGQPATAASSGFATGTQKGSRRCDG